MLLSLFSKYCLVMLYNLYLKIACIADKKKKNKIGITLIDVHLRHKSFTGEIKILV